MMLRFAKVRKIFHFMILLPSICDRRVLSAPYGLSPETGVPLEWKKKIHGNHTFPFVVPSHSCTRCRKRPHFLKKMGALEGVGVRRGLFLFFVEQRSPA